ncbi:hypothetical protein B0J11DRAFT_77552 [Dendryphion nanum]|uniref:Uncharacterized protein n=1 Tax=Dendryphion nanum TaxID=256645 RepID=A0A9P9IG70_9PLEO|nr:hypothetical protein B0J11DRAFT_77552 [Dendryphion nanum]
MSAQEHTTSGHRKIVAQEFCDIDGLRHFYRNQDLSKQAALRVIHVQNASWATRFLLQKYNIDASDDLVGTDFGRWAQYTRPKVRNGKPVLSGKTFKPQRDPWRGVSRSSFALDYLRYFEKGSHDTKPGVKMMELNHYDALDNPSYGYDVFAQRMSVYVQLSDGEPGLPSDPDIKSPYMSSEEYEDYQRLKKQYEGDGRPHVNGYERRAPKLQTLDNGSCIILFEHSHSGSLVDTLIGARQEVEVRWRRLTFYLPPDETSTDDRLAIECTDFILRDIFKALASSWEKYLYLCETHVSILEDKIYENPADESRAPELWTNSSLWLKVERLMYIHVEMVKEMRNHLKQLVRFDPTEDEPWLSGSSEEFAKLITQIREGVVKPTANLSDLMYKSVGIRDARHSLQLGLSMWRLSWITFIFLPLTFVCGFFGMNVDAFENNPSIKWWFVATIPLFAIVIVGWYGVKHSLSTRRQNPLRRGVYEALFQDFSLSYPHLWTRRGPKDGVVPIGYWNGWKWNLITKWFNPEDTITAKSYDPGHEELGWWSRVQRHLARRWLAELHSMPNTAAEVVNPQDFGAIGELLAVSTPLALADADPTAASRIGKRVAVERLRSLSPTTSDGGSGRWGGRTSPGSGVMVEEKSEDEGGGDEGDGEGEENRSASVVSERLNVPNGVRNSKGSW